MSSNMEKFSIRSPVEQNGGFLGLFETDKTLTKLISSLLYKNKIDSACEILDELIKNSELKTVEFSYETQDGKKLNILHLLAMHSKNNHISEIISAIFKSNVNIKNALNSKETQGGQTPVLILFHATENHELVELAKTKGADLSIMNNSGINIMTDKNTTENHNTDKHTTENHNTDLSSDSDDDFSIFNRKTETDKPSTEKLNTAKTMTLTSDLSDSDNVNHGVNMKNNTDSLTVKNMKDLDTIKDKMTNDKMNNNSSVGGFYNSQEILDMLMNTQTGGKKSKNKKMSRTGTRHVNTYSEFSVGSPKSDRSMVNRLSRSVENKSEQLHQSAMEKIKSILKDVESKLKGDELSLKARAYKAILYAQVKEKNPSMSNYERAVELEKQVTESNIKNIKKNEASRLEDIANHISEKDKTRSEKMSSDSDKTTMNSEKSTDKKKKTSKKSKDTTEMSGGFESDYAYLEVDTDKVYSVVDFSD